MITKLFRGSPILLSEHFGRASRDEIIVISRITYKESDLDGFDIGKDILKDQIRIFSRLRYLHLSELVET